jgi:SDR family mycofactocin-dependent oxidoreductase
MSRLEGQVAFITGVARGQGRSHAIALAQEGCDIIGVDACKNIATVPYPGASVEDLKKTAQLVEATGQRFYGIEADVRDLAALQQVVDDGVAEFGRLDISIANAGIASFAPTLDMSEEMWSTAIDILLTGVWKSLKASVPKIVAGGRGGSVVITSSAGAVVAHENVAHYSAAKAGLVQLMRVLAKELAPQSIRVNTVHPTSVATDMILNESTYRLFRPDLPHPTREDYIAAHLGMNALPIAMIESIDVSNAILYLVTDEGRYVTGACHMVTAGIEL